jgi:ribosomal RNA-processing protein 8
MVLSLRSFILSAGPTEITLVNHHHHHHHCLFIMSRKRKHEVEGDSSRTRKQSNGNDAQKKSKLEHVKTKPQLSSTITAALGGGGGVGDSPWSKSKKKRMRNLKSRLLKKQVPTSVDAVKAVKKKYGAPTHAACSPTKHQQHGVKQTAPTDSSEKKTKNSLIIPPPRAIGQSSALQQAFQARLSGSRFRILNEELYTTTSTTAFERFSAHPELYDEYHDGFRSQVEHWPVNPVDVIVGRLKKEVVDAFVFDNHHHNSANTNSSTSSKNQPQDNNKKQIVVADFGCGDADLAKQLLKVQVPIQQQQQQRQDGAKRQKGGGSSKVEKSSSSSSTITSSSFWCPFCVHSFDLVSQQSDLVTACDMSNVPLASATVDVAVFCLSLMGTNLADFVREAHRVLKSTGRLKIAEVKSRFSSSASSSSTTTTKSNNKNNSKNNNSRNNRNQKNNNKNNAAAGTERQDDEEREFIHVLNQLGFECTLTDRSNKMFVLFELRKNGKTPDPEVEYTAKPCIYKRR